MYSTRKFQLGYGSDCKCTSTGGRTASLFRFLVYRYFHLLLRRKEVHGRYIQDRLTIPRFQKDVAETDQQENTDRIGYVDVALAVRRKWWRHKRLFRFRREFSNPVIPLCRNESPNCIHSPVCTIAAWSCSRNQRPVCAETRDV